MDSGVSEVGEKCTLMKNFFEEGSPNCCESTMLKLRVARKPVTACTIPGLSGQESVRMYSSALAILTVLVKGGSTVVWCAWDVRH